MVSEELEGCRYRVKAELPSFRKKIAGTNLTEGNFSYAAVTGH
jgi:hypothetical protein